VSNPANVVEGGGTVKVLELGREMWGVGESESE